MRKDIIQTELCVLSKPSLGTVVAREAAIAAATVSKYRIVYFRFVCIPVFVLAYSTFAETTCELAFPLLFLDDHFFMWFIILFSLQWNWQRFSSMCIFPLCLLRSLPHTLCDICRVDFYFVTFHHFFFLSLSSLPLFLFSVEFNRMGTKCKQSIFSNFFPARVNRLIANGIEIRFFSSSKKSFGRNVQFRNGTKNWIWFLCQCFSCENQSIFFLIGQMNKIKERRKKNGRNVIPRLAGSHWFMNSRNWKEMRWNFKGNYHNTVDWKLNQFVGVRILSNDSNRILIFPRTVCKAPVMAALASIPNRSIINFYANNFTFPQHVNTFRPISTVSVPLCIVAIAMVANKNNSPIKKVYVTYIYLGTFHSIANAIVSLCHFNGHIQSDHRFDWNFKGKTVNN